MSRIRTIKPEFFKHLELCELENENQGQYVMLVYAGLWTQCDKNGVFRYNDKILKNEILPYINFDMSKTLSILETKGYFVRFNSDDDKEYGFIQNFRKYQFPSRNEKSIPSKYPLPPDTFLNMPRHESEHAQAHSGTCPGTNQNNTEPEGSQDKGSQDKGSQESSHAGSAEPSQSEKDAIKLSTLLLNAHRAEIPNYLSGKDDQKTINRWALDIEKLIRIDQKPPEIIKQVIFWAKTPGNFWFSNIESGKKLREKYETLYSQMQTRTRSPPPHISADHIPKNDIEKYFREAGTG
ncbi:MAG: hypothetical protein FWF29_06680 [Treponema sp.]|nr:hypothetical protein [Treponema sp.]